MTTIPMPLMNKLMTQSPTRKLLAIAICGLGTLSVTTAPVYADDDGSFWTQFVPSADTRLIFVSSEEGNDNNSGLNPNAPVKTLAKGYELLRDGYPDWMLLKRGDVWYESLPFWAKSGRAEDEKLVVGAYGDSTDRPQIRPDGSDTALRNHGEERIAHVAFVGLHLEPHDRLADEGAPGISWKRESDDILFEDLYIAGFGNNINLQPWPQDNLLQNLRVNGCVIVDSWNTTSHSQGLFAAGITGLTIQNSVFDHNGWNLAAGAEPTIFNHNAYIQSSNTEVVSRNNYFLRGSATGIQMRAGGIIENNVFYSNPVAFTIGSPSNHTMDNGINAVAFHNTVLNGRGISDNAPRSNGIYISNAQEVAVYENIFAHGEIGYNGEPIIVHGSQNGPDIANISIDSNIFFAWPGAVSVREGQDANVYDSIQISRNRFYLDFTNNNGRSAFDKPALSIFASDNNLFRIYGNEYHHFGMHNKPFYDGTFITTSQWASQVETSATFYDTDSIADQFQIGDMLEAIMLGADTSEFITNLREQSRFNPIRVSTTHVYEWYKESITGRSHR